MPYIPSEKTDGYSKDRVNIEPLTKALAEMIARVSRDYEYHGAFAGHLNFALTRLIQHLFRALEAGGESQSELKYSMQAIVYGVLLDVALEHKNRVNESYEIHQLLKSGDCYDTPYYSKPVEVVDGQGNHTGYVYVNVKRSDKTVEIDKLPGKIVING